jgi:single-strand DNA-binding protein
MSSINKIILVGNVGKQPEVRALQQSGNEVATFTLATSETWKDKSTGEKREATEWHPIVIFNKHLVSFVKQYVNKGDKLYIEGKLKTRKWQDKNGADKYSTEIVLENFQGMLVSLKNKNNNEANSL